MTDKQREKDNLKSVEVPNNLMKLPPKWNIKKDGGYFYYLDENKIEHFISRIDNDVMRMYCWSVYNKIEGK